MCLLTICVSSLIQDICPFLNQIVFFVIVFSSSLYILDISSLSEILLANTFSYSVGHFLNFYVCMYVFLAVLGRCCWMWAFWGDEQGQLFVAVLGLLTAVASLVAEHRL